MISGFMSGAALIIASGQVRAAPANAWLKQQRQGPSRTSGLAVPLACAALMRQTAPTTAPALAFCLGGRSLCGACPCGAVRRSTTPTPHWLPQATTF